MKISKLWQQPEQRSERYYLLDNIFSAITHGIGFGLSVTGLVILIVKAAHTGSPMRVVTFTIYGSCLVLLYLFSTLYHSLVFTRAKNIFQIFDHSSIFLFDCRILYSIFTCCNWWSLGLDFIWLDLGPNHLWHHLLHLQSW